MIRVQNLVKNFGDFAAVRDISFEVAQGEIFAFELSRWRGGRYSGGSE